jgi:hypothetical protein
MPERLRFYFGRHPGRFAAAVALFALAYAWVTVEAWLICRLIGLPVDVTTALTIEVLAVAVDGLLFMVPAKVGTQELGKTAIFGLLHLSARSGLAFGIVRHLREVSWASIGLLVYASRLRRADRRGGVSLPSMAGALRIGSDEHKALFCRTFVETHDPFRPDEIVWPSLDAVSLARLKALPIWDEAVRTETETALRVETLGRAEKDAALAEAIALQGYEEGRHARLLCALTEHYGISLRPHPAPVPPREPVWAFMRTSYGECMDSFFAFGLFALGKRSGFFPVALTDIFERVMQEEARHILFAVNWAAWLRARRPVLVRPAFDMRRSWSILMQAFGRARGAMHMRADGLTIAPRSQQGFTLQSHASFGDLTARSFLELCLHENERRLAPYDARLLRPALVPPLVRLAVRLLPRPKTAGPVPADTTPAQ